MGKKVADTVLDQSLNYIKNNANEMHALAAEPADYAAVTGNSLADATMATGDYTVENGDTNGRKVTVSAKNGEAIDSTGTATHIALIDTTGTALLYVTTCSSLSLTSGQTVNFGTWDIEISDPS